MLKSVSEKSPDQFTTTMYHCVSGRCIDVFIY